MKSQKSALKSRHPSAISASSGSTPFSTRAIAAAMRSMDAMAALVQFGPIVILTALFNAIVVAILIIPLRKALKRD